MTLVLMQNTRLPKYCPLSSTLKAAYLPLPSSIFLKCIVLYLLKIFVSFYKTEINNKNNFRIEWGRADKTAALLPIQ
jgi:hypothetical protein